MLHIALTTVIAIMGIYGTLSALYRHIFTLSERSGQSIADGGTLSPFIN